MDKKTLGLAALAMVFGCAPVFAQGAPEDNAPVAAQMIGSAQIVPDEPAGPGEEGIVEPDGRGGPGGPRRMGPGGERGGWGGRGGHGRHEFGLSRMLSSPEMQQKVGVSAEQVAKIRGQETAFQKTAVQQRADLEVKQIDLREMLSADKPDRAAIDRKLQEISTAKLAMDKSRVGFRLDMKEALTPEQREKLKAAMKEKWEARRGQMRRGPGGPGGPGGRGQRGPRPGGPSGPTIAPDAKPGE
jgi:Spy/CpxP family protein refolding chaperone